MKLKAIFFLLFAKQYTVITSGKLGNNDYNSRITRAKTMGFLLNAVKYLSKLMEVCNDKKEATE